ncbi:hypothetical protein KHA80_13275 [Anaerobacillus sp. HL2]|nr:hypothetical protein KHA80_13275 [Anaerobacillus sp. HL2]
MIRGGKKWRKRNTSSIRLSINYGWLALDPETRMLYEVREKMLKDINSIREDPLMMVSWKGNEKWYAIL